LKSAERKLTEARQAALQLDWVKAVQDLDQARIALDEVIPRTDVSFSPEFSVREAALPILLRMIKAMHLTAGFEFKAESSSPDVVIGEPIKITVSFRCRAGIHCTLKDRLFASPGPHWLSEKGQEVRSGDTYTLTLAKEDFPSQDPTYAVPEVDSAVRVLGTVVIQGSEVGALAPAVSIQSSSVAANLVPLRIVPAYTLKVEPTQTVAILNAPRKSSDVYVRVHSYSAQASKGSVGLETPDGFTSSAPVQLSFDGVGDQYAKLTVTPPAKLAPGNFTITAYAKRGDEKFSTSLEPLPTKPSILWSEPAQTVVHAFDINVPANLHVGYITAEGEMIPEALKRLGISVEMLDANALTFGDLSKYTTIVVGVRAYELRPELASANKRLLDYVSNGGMLVVQYNRDFIWNKFLPAPYHATIGNPTPRITDETAEVKFLKPDDPLLNSPNKITAADFQNWVQERGLYYWSDFDAKYTPLLSMHDPGEKDLNGGLVYTHLGKGVYIYTGLAFFRELPEGVPGAYRLFVNLLSASQSAH
jgi:hypothetical protein